MKCEKNVITMTLHWHSYQVYSYDNCVNNTPTKTRLSSLRNTLGSVAKSSHVGRCVVIEAITLRINH